MVATIIVIAVVLVILTALLWTPVAAFLAYRKAPDEDARKPHRAKLREWFRMGGMVLVAFALLSGITLGGAEEGLPISSFDMATAALGVVLFGISYLYLRDPEE
jgi:hypothetical protein